MDRSMIYDIRVLQDTFWYQKTQNYAVNIFIWQFYYILSTNYDVYFQVIRGKIVRGSVFWQFVRTVSTNAHELIRTN